MNSQVAIVMQSSPLNGVTLYLYSDRSRFSAPLVPYEYHQDSYDVHHTTSGSSLATFVVMYLYFFNKPLLKTTFVSFINLSPKINLDKWKEKFKLKKWYLTAEFQNFFTICSQIIVFFLNKNQTTKVNVNKKYG